MHWHAAAPLCVEVRNGLLTFNALPTPYKCLATCMNAFTASSFAVFLAKHVGKDSSGTFYVAFRDPGQIPIIRDCPGDSGTVGAYEYDLALHYWANLVTALEQYSNGIGWCSKLTCK